MGLPARTATNRFTSFALPLILAGSTGMAAAAEDSATPANVEAGRAVALKVCASCHTVSAGPQRKPYLRSPASNFREIANRPGTTTASLLQFLATRHQSVVNWREMPGVKTTEEQNRAVADYIMSLRRPARSPR